MRKWLVRLSWAWFGLLGVCGIGYAGYYFVRLLILDPVYAAFAAIVTTTLTAAFIVACDG